MLKSCIKFALLALATVWTTTGCVEQNDGPVGLGRAAASGGPKIVFDLEARPFPEIPFPNNLATRADPTSPTGKRVNVSLHGASEAEEEVRAMINRQSGFGVISPIWVRFDAPLDLENILARHAEPVPDQSDDAVFIVNVDPKSDAYGELVQLDIGRGNYPVLHPEPDRYFDNDPRKNGTNLLFESEWEYDLDGNGALDPIEDTDDDGVWDVPNLLDPEGDPYAPGQTLEFYERETNSLIIRTIVPLDPTTTYAVVLTSRLQGENGLPIDSPFEWVNHLRQTDELEPLRTILPRAFPDRFDERLQDVRFAWTFTTQDATEELVAIRAGLYGEGPLGWLEARYPPNLNMIHNGKKPGAEEPFTFKIGRILDFLVPLLTSSFGVDSKAADAMAESFDNIDYVVSGSYLSPYFLTDKDGHADQDPVKLASLEGNPADDDEHFDIDLSKGTARVGEDEVTFMCTVPTTIPGVREPPFNTIIYSHAISSTRLEVILLFGGSMAKFGFAMCAIDAVGHGVAIPPEFLGVLNQATEFLDVPGFAGIVDHHRARDLNNDGSPESGGKYFTSDILHSRDNFRQTTVDQLQLIRILRSWDGTKRWPSQVDNDSPYIQARGDLVAGWDQDGDGESEIAGDFNADGVVDFGGDVAYAAFGTSLGGIQSAVLAGIEPRIRAVASNAGGGILGEIANRTEISNVRNGVHLRMMGPLLLGDRVMEGGRWRGKMALRWYLATADQGIELPFGVIDGIDEGDRIVLRNPNREAREVIPEEDRTSTTYVRDGRFRISIATDALGATARRAVLGFDPAVSTTEDIMGCVQQTRCRLEQPGLPTLKWECPNAHVCGEPDQCIPMLECVWGFDASSPEPGSELELRTVTAGAAISPEDLGDPLRIEIYSASGNLKQVIDEFPENVVYENILYPKGAPLASLSQGWGLKRQTPNFRKFLAIAQTLLEVADPAVWATKYRKAPLAFPYEDPRFQTGETNLLMVGTVGDTTVPTGTGINIARSAGIVDFEHYDPRWNMTANQFLVANFVYEGIHWFDRFPSHPNTLFDADDMDAGRFREGGRLDAPNVDARFPLQATVAHPDGGLSALRLPYLRTSGEHTFNAPNPSSAFDVPAYMTNQVGWYLLHSGRELRDDDCMELLSMQECDFFDVETFEPPRLR